MTQNWDTLKAQYLRSSQETQLQNLALNLTRIHLFAQSGANGPVAQHLVRKTQFFIEWVVPGIDLATDLTSSLSNPNGYAGRFLGSPRGFSASMPDRAIKLLTFN